MLKRFINFNENSQYNEKIPANVDILTLKEFDEMIDDGLIMDDDGIGYYSNGRNMNRKLDVFDSKRPNDATHVIWFNK